MSIFGFPASFTDGVTTWDANISALVTGGLESQSLAALQILAADYPNGGVVKVPNATSWAVSDAGVVSPGAGVATHPTYKALYLRTTAPLTVTTATTGFEASATGLYLFMTIEVTTGNDSRKTGVPKLVLSDSPTYNGGILIASGVATDSDSITSATDAREFIEFGEGSTPTGTGIPHVVGGVMQTTATRIINNDIDPAAAIAISKINGLQTALDGKSASGHTHALASNSAAGFLSTVFWNLLNAATNAASASTLVLRDASARIKVAAGVASDDAVNVGQLNAALGDLEIEGAPKASDSVSGISKLSVAPADSENPIAAGTNDPRLQVFGFAGSSHAVGIVPDPGVTPHDPPYQLTEQGWQPPTESAGSNVLNSVIEDEGVLTFKTFADIAALDAYQTAYFTEHGTYPPEGVLLAVEEDALPTEPPIYDDTTTLTASIREATLEASGSTKTLNMPDFEEFVAYSSRSLALVVFGSAGWNAAPGSGVAWLGQSVGDPLALTPGDVVRVNARKNSAGDKFWILENE